MRSILSVVAVAALCGVSHASVVWTGSDAGGKSAAVEFDIDGSGNLVVTLTNTSMADILVPSDVLTAVVFDIDGPAMSLSRISGLLAPGSVVIYDGQPVGGVIGGEWAYRAGITGAQGNRQYGISSSGLGGLFGPGDLIPGDDLAPPPNPDGLQYGLLSAGDDISTGNGGVIGSGGLIKNAVVFRLGGAGANFDLNRINNVLFIYGTAIGEGEIPGAPTPGAALLLAAGGAMIATRRKRR